MSSNNPYLESYYEYKLRKNRLAHQERRDRGREEKLKKEQETEKKIYGCLMKGTTLDSWMQESTPSTE